MGGERKMWQKKKLGLLGFMVFLAIASFMLGFMIRDGQAGPEDNKTLEPFLEIFSLVRSQYVEPVKVDNLVEGAIEGMLKTLGDPHTRYMNAVNFHNMQEETKGYFGGLGIVVGIKDEQLTVVAPIEKTPADRAGIKAGDQIKAIDQKSTKNMPLEQAVTLMRGAEGSQVSLDIYRPASKDEKVFKITRAKIDVPSIASKMLENKIGYIRMSGFTETTGRDFRKALKELNDQGAQALILDLRNNPGGLLKAAVEVGEQLLPKGPIVHIKERSGQTHSIYATGNSSYSKWPLVVLVNEGSASASEIVSGAVQDTKRGILVGEKTFGKGSVQTVYPLQDGSGIALTTAKYFTPSGRSIHKIGIEPNVKVKLLEENGKVEKDNQLEKALEVMQDKLKKSS